MSQERLILTPQQAATVFPDGDTIHNFANPGFGLIGCDYARDDAIDALNNAVQIEVGGDQCKSMGHGLVVWATDRKYTFFETDAERLEKLEAELSKGSAT